MSRRFVTIFKISNDAPKSRTQILLKKDYFQIENAFRGAIEGLYGLKSTNPKLLEEAKQLAGELRVFRDAASNKVPK